MMRWRRRIAKGLLHGSRCVTMFSKGLLHSCRVLVPLHGRVLATLSLISVPGLVMWAISILGEGVVDGSIG